jgi:predicted transcriptional regulator of viral defense system
MPGRVYDHLYDIALDRYGYVRSQDARAAGVDPRRLVEMERRGTLERVAHGLYRFPAIPASDFDQLMEATLWPRGQGVISHESALDLHDLCDVSPIKVHVTVPKSYRSWGSATPALVLHRRDLPAADVVRHEGIPVVSPLRAIRDGIEQQLGDRLLDQSITAARRRGLISSAELDHLVSERAGEGDT